MFSYCLFAAKDKIKSLVMDFCPCLNPVNKKSHNIEDIHRKSRIQNTWEANQEDKDKGGAKIFTIESMKRLATKRMVHDGTELQETKDSFILERCPWDSESSDMILRVGRYVFPVHRFLLSIESEILRTIIDSIPAACNRTTMVTLNGYDADEIKMLLTFVYLPESEIDDENVFTLLKLADELMIEELVIRCEDYLLTTHNKSPILLLQLAHKYQLPSLEESASIQASKINNIEEDPKFKQLNEKQQEKVVNMSRNRYRSGSHMNRPIPPDRDVRSSDDGNDGTAASPELKMERRLRDVPEAAKFEGRLKFVPDNDNTDDTQTRTRT